ncbi:MAG TPA: glucose-1-phosphate adenylyltransferase, partial [Anaerolineae bacterium]|nr:glucose-1-phosphate adenylyltransferase [Anaerolineae bacterium]HIQ06568.1 glucose-1-phosphate adenylyltransferase [Anaerolineae bacterium]
DFGRDVIPNLVESSRVYAYEFQGYWADVGTVQAYYEANMALLAETAALDLYDPEWVIHTRSQERPAVWVGPEARVDGNLLCDGARIDGRVIRSIISPGVYIAPDAVVRDSIIMNDTTIGPGAVVDRAIIDKEVVVGEGALVGEGEDNTPNRQAPELLNTGITMVGKWAHLPVGVRIGRNVVVEPRVSEADFPADEIPSGETVSAGARESS